MHPATKMNRDPRNYTCMDGYTCLYLHGYIYTYTCMDGAKDAASSWKVHWENCISISFHIEWDMIVGTVTVFFSIWNQMDFHLVQIRKENCHHDHIPFNVERKWEYSFLSVRGKIFIRIRNTLLSPSLTFPLFEFIHYILSISGEL